MVSYHPVPSKERKSDLYLGYVTCSLDVWATEAPRMHWHLGLLSVSVSLDCMAVCKLGLLHEC